MGGDLFAIIYEAKTGKGVEKIDRIGVYAITVPECVAGWDALRKRFGKKPFSELLASAIFYAETGFPLPELGARSWISQALLKRAEARASVVAARVSEFLFDRTGSFCTIDVCVPKAYTTSLF